MTAVLVACGVCSGAEAPTYATLYQFTGYLGGPDGSFPIAPVVIGPGGVLYGTAGGGGVSGYGTVFSLRPPAGSGGPWTMYILYNFAGPVGPGADGVSPYASLLVTGGGIVCGTTSFG